MTRSISDIKNVPKCNAENEHIEVLKFSFRVDTVQKTYNQTKHLDREKQKILKGTIESAGKRSVAYKNWAHLNKGHRRILSLK